MLRVGQNQRGLGHAAVLLALVVLAVVVGGGYYVYGSNQQQTATKQAEQAAASERQEAEAKQKAETENIARTDKEQILVALNVYCKGWYKDFWEATYNRAINSDTVTSGYDESVKDPFVIDGDYALVRAAKCDTPELTEMQKFAPFMLYFTKKDDVWTAKERYQTTPPCKDFAGTEWPKTVLPECEDEPDSPESIE